MSNLKGTDGTLTSLNPTILWLSQADGEGTNLWQYMPLKIKIKEWGF